LEPKHELKIGWWRDSFENREDQKKEEGCAYEIVRWMGSKYHYKGKIIVKKEVKGSTFLLWPVARTFVVREGKLTFKGR